MTSRLTSATLDMSRLPPPNVIEPLDYEILRTAFIDKFVPLIEAALGIDYNVDGLETDPAIIIGEAMSYLRLLDRARVNDAARAVLLPFALNADLDNLGSFFGVDRFPGEDDTSFRFRIGAAPDAYAAAGPVGAYVFHATTASPLLVKDVGVRSPTPGAVLVSILSKEPGNGAPSFDLLQTVRARLERKDIKPLTVALTVQAASITAIDVTLTLLIPTGPDPNIIRLNAEKAVRAYAEERHAVGKIWRWKGLVAAAKVAGVEDVVQFLPLTDIDPGLDGAVFMNSLTIGVEVGS
jgi:phage-related baseplate assembly protein